jgi:hypothetical protein
VVSKVEEVVTKVLWTFLDLGLDWFSGLEINIIVACTCT